MHYKYTIEENDLVAFNLQIALNSEDTKKKRKISTIILTALAVCFTIYFIYRHEMAMAVVTLIIGIVTLLFYPKYFNQQYKKQFRNHVKKMFPNRIGKEVELDFTETHAVLKTTNTENTTEYSAIINVEETKEYFFLKLDVGSAIILPKRVVSDIKECKLFFQNKGLRITKN
jgi:DhnA family fructose-bisphosphate aldolase class Ia